MKRLVFIILMLVSIHSWAFHQPEFSKAFIFQFKNTAREVYSKNVDWRFYKGAINVAFAQEFDDNQWGVVSLPHGIEYLPNEASGCINYQGEVLYRKHFKPTEKMKNKELFLHFKAIMGKSKVWING